VARMETSFRGHVNSICLCEFMWYFTEKGRGDCGTAGKGVAPEESPTNVLRSDDDDVSDVSLQI
jgi:hypothetical protein